MTFAFYLKEPQRNLPDSRQKKTPIVLVVSHCNRKYKKQIGISVIPGQFKKQRTKNERENERLRAIENYLNSTLNQFSTGDDVAKAVERAVELSAGENPTPKRKEGGGVRKPTFWQYFREWAERDVPSKRQRKNICKLVASLMGTNEDWDEVDTSYYFRLTRRMNDAKYSVNYQGSVVSRLKSVLSEGFKLKYHTNGDYHQFTRHSEQPDTVYLTADEVERLWKLELKDPMERRVRDLFLLGCYTAMRFSDYSRLTASNIRDGFIYMTQKKTAGSVIIPASPKVVEILKRNAGAAPKVNQIVFNREIKTVCCRAGISEKIEVTKSKGEGHITSLVPKYTQVSSHTARRTGATILHKTGIPIQSLMLITGHKSAVSLMRYLRTTKEENALALKDNPFFK